MATKKEKREAALAKREKFLAEQQASGLAAQKAAQEHEAKIVEQLSSRFRTFSSRMEDSLRAEIIAKSEQFGERVRLAEDCQLEHPRVLARRLWTEFLRGLKGSPHREAAVKAYNDAYSGSEAYVLRATLKFVNTSKEA